MNRGFGFLLAVPLFFIGIFLMLEVNYVNEETEAYEEYILNFAIDYATDAAAGELLEMAHVGTDYQDWGKMNTDPEVAKKTFETVMLLSYNYPLTDKAYLQLDSSYLPLFVVAAYDGYYVYEQVRDDVSGYRLVSTPKIPYSLEKNGAYYAINLGLDNCRKLKDGQLTLCQLADEGISQSEVMFQINAQVSDDIAYRYQQYLIEPFTGRGDKIPVIHLPQGMTTMSAVNAIEGPTVLSVIDNWDLETSHPVSAFSIGGARIEVSRQVAAHTRDGIKYYAYADLLPDFGPNWEIKLDSLYPSVVEAAKAGYHYDPFYMG